ncbi:MAG TPA: hypothetical protein P5298_09695 [Spirochaetia bacterium]|nr:hypothetical protein [Spirochaetia bacterium]
MIASSCKYESLSSRETFNASVRHVKATVALAESLAGGENLADALDAMIADKAVGGDEILPFVSMLLVDKFGYYAAARNARSTVTGFDAALKAAASWNAFDLVMLYNHPDVGVIAVNPKNPAHVAKIDRVNKSELLVAYVGCFGKEYDASLATKAADALLALYEGEAPKEIPALLKGPCAYKAPKESPAPKPAKVPKVKKGAKPGKAKAGAKAQAAAPVEERAPAAAPKPAAGPKPGSRMTPMYGVLVTNELFHNGNVEAWKRIIDSFKVKHPDLDVLVYYDGERIVNLNALFKWGKVKHGSVIQFAVAGENICDVAKLQRYLAQGASPMFEAFLRGPVNGVLALF